MYYKKYILSLLMLSTFANPIEVTVTRPNSVSRVNEALQDACSNSLVGGDKFLSTKEHMTDLMCLGKNTDGSFDVMAYLQFVVPVGHTIHGLSSKVANFDGFMKTVEYEFAAHFQSAQGQENLESMRKSVESYKKKRDDMYVGKAASLQLAEISNSYIISAYLEAINIMESKRKTELSDGLKSLKKNLELAQNDNEINTSRILGQSKKVSDNNAGSTDTRESKWSCLGGCCSFDEKDIKKTGIDTSKEPVEGQVVSQN